jgi:hypothetical protein
MAKKTQRDPSDCVRDEFRERNAGVVDVPMNDKRSTSNFYVDRSTLGTHVTGYDKNFKPTTEENHIKQMARDSMGDIRHSPASKAGQHDRENRGFRCATGRHGAGQCNCAAPRGY